ncbi:hypothetical protein [Natrarchaeobius chitinivorans]|uniref:Uncharacterized protein n=1 Tax=Natrarchaeobius chitinivorans TaxID=1679083 RepID=A0A3N6MD87_NATCH|nr:hypothetical protein [Natrarchaeobius chitinivorans]RQG94570.1 hypothetical protein EA473_10805 [Natrarchaeobius chitinivorans]
MPIPGYDPGTVAEFTLDRAGARLDVVAGVVPETVGLEPAATDPPAAALSKPVELVGLDELRAIEAIRIELVYDPAALPPGASPTDVAVGVETDDGWTPIRSAVDLEETTVTAASNDRPPGSTVVAMYAD